MAVAFDAVYPSSAGNQIIDQTPSGTFTFSDTWSHTCAGANRAVVVVAALGDTGTSDAGISLAATYGGVSMTAVTNVHSGGKTRGFVQMFILTGPPVGISTVVVTATGPTTGGGSRILTDGSVSFTGVDQSTPYTTPATATGTSAAPSVTITGTATGMIVDGCTVANGTGFAKSGTATSRWLLGAGTNSLAGNAASSTKTAAGSTTMTYTTTSSDWGILAINLLQVSVAPAFVQVGWLSV